jgi:hypothetical protein
MKDTDDSKPEKPMKPNERIMKDFCDQFTPALRYVKTDRINNIKFPNAFTTSYWDGERSIGITAVCYEGQIHAFIEAAGNSDIAKGAGQVMAKAMDLFGEGSQRLRMKPRDVDES